MANLYGTFFFFETYFVNFPPTLKALNYNMMLGGLQIAIRHNNNVIVGT